VFIFVQFSDNPIVLLVFFFVNNEAQFILSDSPYLCSYFWSIHCVCSNTGVEFILNSLVK